VVAPDPVADLAPVAALEAEHVPDDLVAGHDRPDPDRVVGQDARPVLVERLAVAARHARHHQRDRVALVLEEDRQVGRLDLAQGHGLSHAAAPARRTRRGGPCP
jgi:hypothetical protein